MSGAPRDESSTRPATREEVRAIKAEYAAKAQRLLAGVNGELGALRAEQQTPVAVRGSRALGKKLGYYEMQLRDGTLGYSMRRADDCFQAAIASALQVPMPEVPDWRLDEHLAAGKDPEAIGRSAWLTMIRWADRRGLTIVIHTEPPISERRWIGIVPATGTFDDHCLVMSRREILHDPMSFLPNSSSGHQPGDIEFGITIRKE